MDQEKMKAYLRNKRRTDKATALAQANDWHISGFEYYELQGNAEMMYGENHREELENRRPPPLPER